MDSKAQERFDAFSIAIVIRIRFDRVADRPLLERGEGSPRDAEEENGRQARWSET